jgi:exopolysaccharide biosynthesis operon protein EpsL
MEMHLHFAALQCATSFLFNSLAIRNMAWFSSKQSSLAHRLAGTLALLPFGIGTDAFAQTVDRETEPVRPFASYTFNYDDNVLGLPDEASARALTGSSDLADWSRTLRAGVQFDIRPGRQQLTASVSADDVSYRRFSQLDHRDNAAAAQWNWSAGSHLDGHLSAEHSRSLVPFTDFHELTPNQRTTNRYNADARWSFHPDWRIRAALGRSTVDYSLEAWRVNDRAENAREAELDYVVPSGSAVGVLVRRVDGRYPESTSFNSTTASNDFTQDEARATVDWIFSGKTRLQFSGGIVSRKHPVLPGRDFRGTNARLHADWAATRKISIGADAWREIVPIDDLTTAYALGRGGSVMATWSVSEKLSSVLQLRRENRDFLQSNAALPVSGYADTIKSVNWSIRYVPARHWQVDASLFYNSKDANETSDSFARHGGSIGLQYVF